ncbi:MAG: hypothetical protein QXL61_04470, partial [Archaeoglobaceae archaeon]
IKVEHDYLQPEVSSTSPRIDLKRIADDLKRDLPVRENVYAENLEEFRLPVIKNFGMLYEDDEVVRHSVERLLKRKVGDEFCGRMRDLMDLDLQIENGDLILVTRLKAEEK